MNPLRNDLSRRTFVSGAAKTFLGVSTAAHFGSSRILAAPGQGASPLKQAATARNVIYLYMSGGMSHLDTFDPKPEKPAVMGLTKVMNTNVDGIRVSNNIPLLARQMDKLAVVRSMMTTQGAHEQGNYYQHTSYTQRSSIRHPSMGAWLQKFQDRGNPTLPGSVMIGNDSRHPGAGFFESRFAPLMINDPESGINNVKTNQWFTEERFNSRLSVAKQLDRQFAETYNVKNVRAYADMYDDALKMMKSEELAAFDLSAEPEALRNKYGSDRFGQGCILARRLVERGVRFIELSTLASNLGGGNGPNPWDHHGDLKNGHAKMGNQIGQPIAALIKDLKARGLLDTTLVVWAGEFGRTPFAQGTDGRDHNPLGFSVWMAGGGAKPGYVYGATDDFGYRAVDRPCSVYDMWATVLHLLGIDHDALTFRYSGRDIRLTDVHGHVLKDVVA